MLKIKKALGGGSFKGYLVGTLVFFGAFLATLVMSSIFTPVQPSDAYSVATILNSNGYTINLTASSQVDMNIAATAGGVYASVKDTLNVKTNAPGYTLYLSMNNDNTDGNRLYKDGSATSTDYIAPAPGTFSAPAELDNNTWGFALANVGSFDASYATPTPLMTSKWSAVPVRNSAIPIHTSAVANPDPGDDIDIYYGVKANTALPSGIYSNVISYSAVANGTSLDIAAISPERTDRLTGGTEVTITTSLTADASNVGSVTVMIGGRTCINPIVSNGTSGNIIIKCDTPPHDTGTYDVAVDIPTYNKTYYIAGGIEYYVIALPTISTIQNMQEMTTQICADSTIGENNILADTRDNNTYTVRKMEDNKCWMTQNLRLGNTASDVTLTPADSNVLYDFTIPASAVQTSGTTDWGAFNDATAINTIHVFNNGNKWIRPTSSGNAATVNSTGTPPNQSQYIGNHYNWHTATAGYGSYQTPSDINVGYSICPKGWRLPTTYRTSPPFTEYSRLTGALVGVDTETDSVPDKTFTLQSAPSYFVLSGAYGVAGLSSLGSGGYWWTDSTGSSSHLMNPSNVVYMLELTTSSIKPIRYTEKNVGLSVRCVAQ